MTKDRKSVTVDQDVSEYLSRDDVNASGLVNHLVQSHMESDGGAEALVELRIEQVEGEIDDIKDDIQSGKRKLARKRKKLDRLRSRLSDVTVNPEKVVEEASNILRPEQLTEDNDAVQKHADKARMPTDEFLERVREKMEGNE